ncbi:MULTISPECIES: molybdopterin-dependent oxidoreductase [unclassified Pseudomonas]|uniref:molybdopterin-dependent oxidoreductase n=1 Tax=unclassified Pseudomonas TaxID=196821 RepID=UPI0035C0FF17
MDQMIRGYCTLCRSRCGSINHVRDGRLAEVKPDPEHPTGGALCSKGRSAPEHIESHLRLTKPLRRLTPRGEGAPRWAEITWEEALDQIAARLLDTRARRGAEAVAFAVTTPSGTPMVDSYEWVERFVRSFGSPNLIYAVEICGWHKDYAHALTFGRGIGVPDLEHADTIVLWGHNPARTWLAQASRVAAARQRGAQVVVVDPKSDGSGQQADLWMNIRPGADAALALGAIRHLLATDRFDAEFVTHWTNAPHLVDVDSGMLLRGTDIGLEQGLPLVIPVGDDPSTPSLATCAAQQPRLRVQGQLTDASGRVRRYASALLLLERSVAPYDVEHVAHLTWIDEDKIRAFNALFVDSPRLVYHTWTGVGQHGNATQTERAIATLYALTGACDRKGGNLWTVAPPWRVMNHYPSLLGEGQRHKALGLEQMPLGPPSLGWITARDFARAVLERAPYAVTDLVSFGTNLLVSQADTARNQAALRALEFHVHVDMFMNPGAENADIVLPASMPWEREALRCGFEISQAAVEHIQLRAKMLPTLGECRSDMEVVFDLATRMGLDDAFFGGSIDAAWNHQLEPLGVTVDDLRARPEGIRFPQPFRYEKYRAEHDACAPPGFKTPSQRVELYAETLLNIGQPPLPVFAEVHGSPLSDSADPAYPLVLSTAKSGWFVHSSHRHIPSLRKKSPTPRVQLSAVFAERNGIAENDWVAVHTPGGHAYLQATLDARLHPQVVIADFGWWQGCEPLGLGVPSGIGSGSSSINAILSDAHRDPVSGSVPLRAVACNVTRATALNEGRWVGYKPFRLAARRQESADVMRLVFAPEDGAAMPDFLPGQHIAVKLPGEDLKRFYSLIGPNEGSQRLEIGVRLAQMPGQPDGLMSTRLHELPLGAKVELTEPAGVFAMPVVSRRPLVLMGSGIGITPFLGYLEALALSDRHPERVLLINICRNGHYHPFKSRIAELAAKLPCLELITVYWEALESDRLGVDFDHCAGPDFAWIGDDLLSARPLAYLCGSPVFLESTRAGLRARGFANHDIFDETFSVETSVPTDLAPQPIIVAGEDVTFPWEPAFGTLLDAADRAKVALPSGCRVGQCESCSVKIVSGRVTHLGAYDGPADRCLTCRAVPLEPLTISR